MKMMKTQTKNNGNSKDLPRSYWLAHDGCFFNGLLYIIPIEDREDEVFLIHIFQYIYSDLYMEAS